MKENQRLANRYEFIRQLGEGGTASVYQARDTMLDRYVAIKKMKDEVIQDPDGIQRFLREAKIIGGLDHPNIIKIYDILHHNHSYFIIMEYVEGQSLMEMILEKSFLSSRKAAEIAIQICDGLTHAHAEGIIHRDIKPHNILCSSSGQYKITDFGMSLITDATKLTLTGEIMGSVHYFSPEQAADQEVDTTADIYSLGIVLYEMLTGKVPYDGDNPLSVAVKHINEPIPKFQSSVPIPKQLQAVVLRSLEKNPSMRYQSAHEMKKALENAIRPMKSNQTTSKKPNRFMLYSLLIAACTIGIYGLFQHNLSTSSTEQKSVEQNTNLKTSKDQENTHPWWKELPDPSEETSDIFRNRRVTGKDGEYDITMDIANLPSTKFYYNIYVVDRFNSRLIIENQKIQIPKSVEQGLIPVNFHVSIPQYLLPTEGIAKIEVFHKSKAEDKKRLHAEENLLQQWGEPPNG